MPVTSNTQIGADGVRQAIGAVRGTTDLTDTEKVAAGLRHWGTGTSADQSGATDAELAAALAELNSTYVALGAQIVSVKDYAAVGDGVANDTAAVVAARTAAGVGGTVLFPKGTYLVNALDMSVAGQRWELAPGATLKATVTQVAVTLSAAGCSLIGRVGSTINGNSVGSSVGSTVYITGADCTVEGLSFINCAGIGINAQGTRAVIDRNTLTNGGSVGIYSVPPNDATPLSSVRISNNRVTNTTTGPYGIQVYGRAAAASIAPKILDNVVVLPVASGAGLGIETHTLVTAPLIRGNTVTGGSMGISADSSTGALIQGNTLIGPYTNGIEIATSHNSVVSGNVVNGNAVTANGISIVGPTPSARCAISGNDVFGCITRQITVVGGLRNSISNNVLEGAAPIYISSSAVVGSISGNVMIGGGTVNDAITLEQCSGASVMGNTFDGFARSGVAVYSAGAYTADRLVIGPNVYTGSTPADPALLLGSATFGTSVHLTVSTDATTTTAPAAGGADALPATPLGYVTVNVKGTARKIAYY